MIYQNNEGAMLIFTNAVMIPGVKIFHAINILLGNMPTIN